MMQCALSTLIVCTQSFIDFTQNLKLFLNQVKIKPKKTIVLKVALSVTEIKYLIDNVLFYYFQDLFSRGKTHFFAFLFPSNSSVIVTNTLTSIATARTHQKMSETQITLTMCPTNNVKMPKPNEKGKKRKATKQSVSTKTMPFPRIQVKVNISTRTMQSCR